MPEPMSPRHLTVLILGGYGTFGSRLVRLLRDEAGLTLVVAGRDMERARSFCAGIRGKTRLVPLELDRNALGGELRRIGADVLVDASGPFQSYGSDPYRVARQCVADGVHYMDLADDGAFVDGIRSLDADARRRGVFVLSGLSTFPALSTAAVDALSVGMRRIDEVVAGLSPSPKAGLGGSVVRAIAAYAGRPIGILRAGTKSRAPGLLDLRELTIAPPGKMPLGRFRFGLIDAPDQFTLPRRFPDLANAWLGVATRPAMGGMVLRMAARFVRMGLLRSLSPLAPLMETFNRLASWGEARGGLVVAVSGLGGDGRPERRSWHLVAEGDDGPFIPSIAAAETIRNGLLRRWPAEGARPGDREMPLGEFERAFRRLDIHTGTRTGRDENGTLYRRVLGEALDRLPATVSALHSHAADHAYVGVATATRGSGPVARLVCALFGFPAAGTDIPVTVGFTVGPDAETWRREFAGKPMSSVQSAGRGDWDGLISERFGALHFGLAPVVDGDRLRLVVRKWRAFGVPMPSCLAPGGETWETEVDGRFAFHVEVTLPLVGHVVTYEGRLEPVA